MACHIPPLKKAKKQPLLIVDRFMHDPFSVHTDHKLCAAVFL